MWTMRDGVSGGDAATALLLRRPPDAGGGAAGSLRAEGETASAAAVRLAVSLRDSYLPMQGPPGTGKTYTAAEQILELIAHGRDHRAVARGHLPPDRHRVRAREAAQSGAPRIGQRADRDNPHLHADTTMMSNDQLKKALRDGELDVAAGTTWLWARAGMAASVGTLFVDEAPSPVTPPTRRTRVAFYDGKLHGSAGLERQEIAGCGSGLRIVEVPHQGNTNGSPEEASEVSRLTGS
jgi:hypothetical protein